MYLSPRSAARSRASGVRRAAGRVVVPAARRLPRRVEAAGSSWTRDGSGMILGAGDVWDSMGNVVFMSATLRMRRIKAGARLLGGSSVAGDETVREGRRSAYGRRRS